MGKGTYFQRIGKSFRDSPVCNRKPLIEILGDERVLIENHIQVLVYQPEEIQIGVSFGRVSIRGNGMVFARLTTEQLVICGRIEAVTLHKEQSI